MLPSVGLSVGPSVGSVGLPVGSVGSSLGGVEVGGCEDGGSELGGSLVGVFGAVGRPLSVGAGESVPSPGVSPSSAVMLTFPPRSSAEAAPAAVSEAPPAMIAPAAMRATRIRVFLVISLLPPVARRQCGASMSGTVIDGGWRLAKALLPRFTCAPETRMPSFTLPSFHSNVKAVASAMSN